MTNDYNVIDDDYMQVPNQDQVPVINNLSKQYITTKPNSKDVIFILQKA